MALRVARLRGDVENLVWLSLEARPVGDEFAKRRAYSELRQNLARSELKALQDAGRGLPRRATTGDRRERPDHRT
jgi:hypothetical protein